MKGMTLSPVRPRRRLLAGVLGLGVLFATGWIEAPVVVTDAAFTDTEHASTTVTAVALRPPQIVATPLCVRPPILGGNVFSIQWQWLNASAPYASLTASNVRWKVGTTDNVAVASVGPDANGRYVTTFDTGLLSGLLGSLLGADVRVEMRTVLGTWSSTAVSSMTYNAPLLAGAPTCTVVNG